MHPIAQNLIDRHQLQAHPEGGYFKETLSASDQIAPEGRIERPLYTSILFMLQEDEVSHFHRLQSDELWIHQQGDPLDVVCILPDGRLEILHLGFGPDQVPQAVVKAGTLFGSYVPSRGVSLVACIVAPGFLYSEFELFTAQQLLALYPQHAAWIKRLGL